MDCPEEQTWSYCWDVASLGVQGPGLGSEGREGVTKVGSHSLGLEGMVDTLEQVWSLLPMSGCPFCSTLWTSLLNPRVRSHWGMKGKAEREEEQPEKRHWAPWWMEWTERTQTEVASWPPDPWGIPETLRKRTWQSLDSHRHIAWGWAVLSS